MPIENIAKKAKKGSVILAATSKEERNEALVKIIDMLGGKREAILKANILDVKKAQKSGGIESFLERLTLTPERFAQMLEGVKDVVRLEDPLGRILEEKELETGLKLKKISVPLGVLAVIYEARPNVTVDVVSLCLKSGNAVILKGGSEALNTNRVLIKLIKAALKNSAIPETAVQFLDTSDRQAIKELLKLHNLVDLIIPRGGRKLVNFVVSHSRIPLLFHAEGVNHIYVDVAADLEVAEKVVFNAKTNRPATCNALDTLLVHKEIANDFLPPLIEMLKKGGVRILTDVFGEEFLGLTLSVKVVSGLKEAVAFIARYGSGHSEGIISENSGTVAEFVKRVDAAAIFVNCSTRLHDGGVFGMGAEMGIATGKLHARGPVGVRELTSYKWLVEGKGHLRK